MHSRKVHMYVVINSYSKKCTHAKCTCMCGVGWAGLATTPTAFCAHSALRRMEQYPPVVVVGSAASSLSEKQPRGKRKNLRKKMAELLEGKLCELVRSFKICTMSLRPATVTTEQLGGDWTMEKDNASSVWVVV